MSTFIEPGLTLIRYIHPWHTLEACFVVYVTYCMAAVLGLLFNMLLEQ